MRLRVSVKAGHEAWLAVGEAYAPRLEPADKGEVVCAAAGCTNQRRYRAVGKMSVGGCSVAHLREVDARVERGEL